MSEDNNILDIEFASYGRRSLAWLFDFLAVNLPIYLFLAGVVVLAITWLGVEISLLENNNLTRILFAAAATSLILMALIVVIYAIWWLFALRNGQTPGKQLLGIKVIKEDGSPSGWRYTFLREFVVKGLLMSVISNFTFGLALLVDSLWPLWDRAGKMQTLHDKLLSTIVVRTR